MSYVKPKQSRRDRRKEGRRKGGITKRDRRDREKEKKTDKQIKIMKVL